MSAQPDSFNVAFGEWLKSARKAKGLSQRKLGIVTDKAQATISKLEIGEQTASLHDALMFAFVLGVDLPNLGVTLPDIRAICLTCEGHPPLGFTCNQCGAS